MASPEQAIPGQRQTGRAESAATQKRILDADLPYFLAERLESGV